MKRRAAHTIGTCLVRSSGLLARDIEPVIARMCRLNCRCIGTGERGVGAILRVGFCFGQRVWKRLARRDRVGAWLCVDDKMLLGRLRRTTWASVFIQLWDHLWLKISSLFGSYVVGMLELLCESFKVDMIVVLRRTVVVQRWFV